MKIHHESSEVRNTYILVNDLGSKIKSLRQLGIKTPAQNDPFFTEFQEELAKMIGEAHPNTNVLAIDSEDLAMQILAKANKIRKASAKDAVIVSLCLEIPVSRRSIALEANRIIGFDGQQLGIGSRPGYPSLSEQISTTKIFANNRPVILVDDGSFSGKTLSYILKRFREEKVNVVAVVLGLMFPGALASIKRYYFEDLVVVNEIDHALEWMPDHDFFPFAPNCGKVIGTSANGENYPFFNYDGVSYCVPYILPFSPMHDWATIPKEYGNRISLFCLQKAIELFVLLERINNRKELEIGDIAGINPLVSLPISVGQKLLPQINTSIRRFLHDACEKLS